MTRQAENPLTIRGPNTLTGHLSVDGEVNQPPGRHTRLGPGAAGDQPEKAPAAVRNMAPWVISTMTDDSHSLRNVALHSTHRDKTDNQYPRALPLLTSPSPTPRPKLMLQGSELPVCSQSATAAGMNMNGHLVLHLRQQASCRARVHPCLPRRHPRPRQKLKPHSWRRGERHGSQTSSRGMQTGSQMGSD